MLFSVGSQFGGQTQIVKRNKLALGTFKFLHRPSIFKYVYKVCILGISTGYPSLESVDKGTQEAIIVIKVFFEEN